MGAIVETKCGKLEGFRSGELQIFRGIPFAKPPVGELRFRSPEPAEPWTGVRRAIEFGASAQQPELPIPFPGWDVGECDEDCLYLNVVTPAADAAHRPVLVWIHGGAYFLGSGSQKMYDPENLAARGDVVVVSINYRLGPFAFLHLDDLLGEGFGASGNAGTEDQVAALRWVQDNIEAFGGDPHNVTIFGESAGGMSVGTLLGTPSAAGLFRRAIAQSGAADAVNTREEGTKIASSMLDILGISAGDAEQGRLRDITAEQILAAQDALTAGVLSNGEGKMPFQPVVDGGTLKQRPIDAIADGLSATVDVVIGTTRDEWNLFSLINSALFSPDEASTREDLVLSIGPEAERVIQSFQEIRGADAPFLEISNAILTDRVFRIPALRLAEAQSAYSSRTYSYLFSWEAPLPALGACHGIDIAFVFGSALRDAISAFTKAGPEATALSDKVMDAWISFARSGDPNHSGLPQWPTYDTGRRATMEFANTCQVVDSPQDAERRAWEGIL